ncbi:hypothetical protein [Anoxybacillus ayderensis]|uniref:hypothetical protein n=1 Tax=Anoxybacillus ayderensis TaxID=265546 RepID=UPI002E211144|nr:hypothetical protein [Anoxybacillus ayderensis]MED0687616.1 hypothetical protein [Anoxybacillus ayderensis]
MPYKFTPLEPIQYHEFDFKRFIEDTIHNSVLQQITFVEEWKACWLYVLLEEDKYVKKCIKMRPDTNPLLEKINDNPQLWGMENEIFVYEMNSLHGDTFLFHFDVNKMKNFTLTYRLNKITLSPSEFFLDDSTTYIPSKANDNRLPFFARMFGIPQPFIVADGNKRIMAKMQSGEKRFTGYEFTPKLVAHSFFSHLEYLFYKLIEEMNTLATMVINNVPSDLMKRYSFVFRQSKGNV